MAAGRPQAIASEEMRFRMDDTILNERDSEELIDDDTHLRSLFHQEMGKAHARTLGRQLREIEMTDAWFALFAGTALAVGATEAQRREIAQKVVPPETREMLYCYRYRAK